MAHLHCRKRNRVQTRIQILNPMATLFYVEYDHIAQIQTQIPTPYFCKGQESESEFVPEPVSGNVNKPLHVTCSYVNAVEGGEGITMTVKNSVKGDFLLYYGLFQLSDSDSDSDLGKDSCTIQDFSISSDSDSNHPIEMYVIGTDIYP